MNFKLLLFCFLSIVLLSFSVAANADERKLPLLEFSVIQNGSKSDIKWTMNVPPVGTYFTIEKSLDGKNFTKLIDMPVAENGNIFEQYFETDYQPYKGLSFYRIRQTDESGEIWYSDIITAKFNDSQSARQFSAIPAENVDLQLDLISNQEKQTLYVLRDTDGNDYYTKLNLGKQDNHLVAIDAPSQMAPGIYRIIGAANDRFYSLKLVIK